MVVDISRIKEHALLKLVRYFNCSLKYSATKISRQFRLLTGFYFICTPSIELFRYREIFHMPILELSLFSIAVFCSINVNGYLNFEIIPLIILYYRLFKVCDSFVQIICIDWSNNQMFFFR